MTLARFEPAIPASERPQTHALDRAATGIGSATDSDAKRHKHLLSYNNQLTYLNLHNNYIHDINPIPIIITFFLFTFIMFGVLRLQGFGHLPGTDNFYDRSVYLC
jgi:hypothetical protein